MVNKIRELVALGVPKKRVAKDLGIAEETVYRYASPEGEARVKAQQRRRYEKDRKNKELMEKRRENARRYVRKKRAETRACEQSTKGAGVERTSIVEKTNDVREEA
jgi:predicted transcriptional regulator